MGEGRPEGTRQDTGEEGRALSKRLLFDPPKDAAEVRIIAIALAEALEFVVRNGYPGHPFYDTAERALAAAAERCPTPPPGATS